jgi:hypothetical protein
MARKASPALDAGAGHPGDRNAHWRADARQLDGVPAKAGIKPGHDMKAGKLNPKPL